MCAIKINYKGNTVLLVSSNIENYYYEFKVNLNFIFHVHYLFRYLEL